MMRMCIKQHLSNIWSSIQEIVKQSEVKLKKGVAYKKVCNSLMIKVVTW